MRVPVGLLAFVVPSRLPFRAAIHTCGAPARLSDGGSVFSRYSLQCQKQTATVQIMDMEFRPVQRPLSGSPNAISQPVRKAVQQAVYTIQWQVIQGMPLPSKPGLVWLRSRGGALNEGSGRRVMISKKDEAAGSHLLQALQKLPAKLEAQFITQGATGGNGATPCPLKFNAAMATAVGIIRVAMQEYPLAKLQHLDMGTGCSFSSLDPLLVGLEGSLHQGCHIKPLLIDIALTEDSSVPPAISHSSGIVISGGMGDIGAAVACWSSLECPAGQLLLLGRSGRGQLATSLKLSSCCVTTIACDTSSAADMEDPHPCSIMQVISELQALIPILLHSCKTNYSFMSTSCSRCIQKRDISRQLP